MTIRNLRGEISSSAYDGHPGLNWSKLKHLRTSGLHFDHAQKTEREDTEALAMGRAVHCAILEPEHFPARFVTYTESKSKGEGARKRWEAFQAENADKTILSAEDHAKVWAIHSAVMAHPECQKVLSSGAFTEVPIAWTHPSGLLCKSRLDLITGDAALVDLKTARGISYRALQAQAWSLGYFHQFAFYRRALAFALGKEPEAIPVYAIAVESGSPHDVGVFAVCPESLAFADIDVGELCAKYLRCAERGEWLGQYPEIAELAAPDWVLRDDTEDGEEWSVSRG